MKYSRIQLAKWFVGGLFLAAVGCSSDAVRTHAVRGEVALARADVADLAGCSIEVALESDPTVRASGEIGPDGKFSLESLHSGEVRRGAVEGTYKARLILADDDRTQRIRAAKAVAPRFLRFETSGLTIQVPPEGEVVLNIAPGQTH